MDKQTKNKADGLTYRDRHKYLSLYIFAHFFFFTDNLQLTHFNNDIMFTLLRFLQFEWFCFMLHS